MGDSKQNFIGDDLLQYCKIVDMDANGVTSVKQENMEKILDAIDSLKFQENTPSAVIALTGPNEKAKFILLNFLFDTLEGKGEKRKQQPAAIEGFGWSLGAGNSASIQHLLNIMEAASDQDKTNSKGIFLWPEPFLVKNHDEKQIAIWIMNVSRQEGTNSEELDEITAMVCSRVITLECFPDNVRLRVLDPYRPILVSSNASCPEPIYLEKMCDSSSHQFRCNPLPDNPENLSEDNVMRNLNAAKGMNKLLKIIVNAIIEETLVATSSETDADGIHAVKIGSMKEVITSVVKKSNEHRQQREKCRLLMEQCLENASKQIKENFPHFLETWMETQFSMSTRQEMLELYTYLKKEILEKFKNTVNAFLWKEFNELIDGRCQIDSDKILKHGFKYVDMLTRLAEQQHQLLGYLPLEKLNGITKEVQQQAEKFTGEGKILILHVCKLAHEKIVNYYKEENKNILDNEKKLFIQDATHLGKVYYDEVEKYLSNASYNPLALENLRQKLLARFCEEIKSTFNAEVQGAAYGLEAQKQKLERKRVAKEKDQFESEAAAEQIKGTKTKEQIENELSQKAEGDRKKEEEEEELRQQEEKARSDMEKYLPLAALQLKSTLPHSIKYWIQNHLQLSSVKQMETIYAHTFKGVTGEQQKFVNKKLHAEFLSRVDAQCKAECIDTLKSISQPVMKINQAMKEQFGFHGSLSEAKMAQTAEEEFRKETEIINAEGLVLNMIKLATGRLLEIYKRRNKICFEANEVVTAYRGQMEQYMANAPYSLPKLHSLHSELAEKLIGTFKKAYHLEKDVDKAVSSEAVILSNRISQEFEQYRISNEEKIKRKETIKAIQKMKTLYNEKVEEIFKKYPDGLDAKTLDKYHATIATEVEKLLQMELSSKLREQEALDNHLKVLQDYIDKHWLMVVEENGKRLKKKEERDEKILGRNKNLEVQRELPQQHEAAARTKPALSERASAEHPTVTERRSRNIETLLPPLVFHLQSSRISMAMNAEGHFEILKNESGEEQTPAIVLLTSPPETTFIYGSEAIACLNYASSSTSELEIFTWSIADFFLDTDSTRTKTVIINGQNRAITAEFVLAFLLRKLKDAAENAKDGRCDTALLAIPFWLSSTQRIKVKHAAKIAGFSESYLINEASAAAFNFVLRDARSQGEVVVISENLDRVDTFVYTFTKCDKTVKMISHSGNYDGSQEVSSTVKATSNNEKGTHFLFGKFGFRQNTNPVDREVRDIKYTCKVALGLATSELRCAQIEPNACLSICENMGKWEKLFETVVRDFGWNAIVIREENAVLQGAAALGMNPNIMADYIRDKLAYNVLRPTYAGDIKTIRKLDDLPVKCRRQTTTLPPGFDKTFFYQYILGRQRPIGELRVEGLRYNQMLEPILEITNEAIVNFKCAMLVSTNVEYKCPVADEQVQWKTPNLSKEQIDDFADLLKLLVTPPAVKEDSALSEARIDLLLKCQEMIVGTEKGQYEFKSSLGKTMVLDKIPVAREYAEHPNSSLEGIQSQMESLQKLHDKYSW